MLRRLIAPLVTWRVALVVLPLVSTFILPPLFDYRTYLGQFQSEAAMPGRAQLLETFDAQHYLHLSVHWYQPGVSTIAFWPLWPACIALVRLFVRSPLVSALILANAFAIAASILFHRLAALDIGEENADIALLTLLAWPTAFYLGLPYSESLFLLLVVMLFYGVRKNEKLALVAAFLIPLARPVGVFIVVPLLARRKLLAAAIAGIAVYFLVMQISTGSMFSAFTAQQSFASHGTLARLLHPVDFFKVLFGPGALRAFVGSKLDRIFFIAWLAALVPVWRLNRTYFWYTLVMGLIPAVTLYFASFSRYTLVLFPIFLVLGKSLRPAWRPVALGLLLIVQVVLYILHCNSHWVA